MKSFESKLRDDCLNIEKYLIRRSLPRDHFTMLFNIERPKNGQKLKVHVKGVQRALH